MTEEQNRLFPVNDIPVVEETIVEKCISCEEVLDTENGEYYWSDVKDGALCSGCEELDLNSASSVWVINGQGEKTKVLVSEYHVVTAEYLEPYGGVVGEVSMSREWKSSSAWRGHYETTLEGFVEIEDLTGWTTGMPDETVARKVDLNAWLEEVLSDSNEDYERLFEFAIVIEQTSNVFSQAVGIWVKEGQVEEFKTWLGSGYDVLSEALR